MKKKYYPFVPERASQIEDGEFFSIPMKDGRYACGRILLIERKSGRKTKNLLVGIHHWCGDKKPTPEDIHQRPIIEQGEIHINAIGYMGGAVLGHKCVHEDDLTPLMQIYAGSYMLGFDNLGQASNEDYGRYSSRGSWGLDFARLLAESHFC